DEWMLRHLGTAIHMCGSAPMGPEGDPGAVVDGHGRVHGVEAFAWPTRRSSRPLPLGVPPRRRCSSASWSPARCVSRRADLAALVLADVQGRQTGIFGSYLRSCISGE